MPELPEVETVRRTLEPLLQGRRVLKVEVGEKKLRERLSLEEIAAACLEHEFLRSRRRGKYLLLDLSSGQTLICHLGMTGQLLIVPGAEEKLDHQHLALALNDGQSLRFRDPRRFGLVRALATENLETDERFQRLGMDPLEESFSGEVLRIAAHGRRLAIKLFLLDGRAVAGVGNIYASEALFRAGIHPLRSVSRVSRERWQTLASAITETLTRAIHAGGTSLNDFVDGEGRAGDYGRVLLVYGREGSSCSACSRRIRRTTLGARSTFYCPGCQR